jgi:1,4-dihydroxy-2-naphthoate octaprenyltransferase
VKGRSQSEQTISQVANIPPWRAWTQAARPKTLPAAMSPVVVGIALAAADDAFQPLPAMAALAGALLIQIGTNLANDYFDYVKGVDVEGRKGPMRVAAGGLLSLRDLRVGIAVASGLAALVGVYLVWVGGWPILFVGVASLISALAYTGGPFPIGYHGLGDLFVFIFFGLAAVCGTYFVQALAVTRQVVVASVPIGALTVAILVVNNLRDIETDARTAKCTLAVMIGPRYTRLEYLFLLALAYAVPLLCLIAEWSSFWILLPWLTLPLALRLIRIIYGPSDGPPLNKALARTANLDLLFSLLFALGLVL